ncbi:hypothetical protein LTR36_009782 [Oleoguttula mirabilis]|uniref:SRR1-like domain-containing protein n=1 Tax=Oleoguttula mirabilis TaxID=1507867 RepID=A0AAV9J649_9PEZI|nr:hypothetical protein LTR36_009782 [Oleoguttula mirabilis]
MEDGWTRVGKGKGKPPAFVHGINPPMRDMTVEKIRVEFDSKMKRWRTSSCRKQVQNILDRQRPDEGWQIGNAVCLATASFSRDNWQCRQRSLLQIVAFIDIVRHLQSGQSTKILCYAQEPEYTPLDKKFLASIGVTALELELASDSLSLGAAAQHLNKTAFVFEPFMDLGLESMRELFGADVRLYIGSSMQRWIDDSNLNNAEIMSDLQESFKGRGATINADNIEHVRAQSRQATDFVHSRRSFRFPRFEEDPNVFEGLSIYWKEPQDEADV